MSIRKAALSIALLLQAGASSLPAQTYWRVPSGVSGAFAGAGVGYVLDVAAWMSGDCDFCGPSLKATTIGMGAGGLIGFAAGYAADRRLAAGDTLSLGARRALRTVTFLTPVAAGSALAFAIINPSDEGRYVCEPPGPDVRRCNYEPARAKLMSDESVALLAIGGGAVVGFIAQHRFARALWPHQRVRVSPDGRGLRLTVPIGW